MDGGRVFKRMFLNAVAYTHTISDNDRQPSVSVCIAWWHAFLQRTKINMLDLTLTLAVLP